MNSDLQPQMGTQPGGASYRTDLATQLASGVLTVMYAIFTFTPLLAISILYAFSWRVQTLVGHWPRPNIDDPKFSAPGDWLSSVLYSLVIPLTMIAFAGVIVLPLLAWVLRHKYSRTWLALSVFVFVAGLLFLVLDPGRRLTWFMD